MIGSVNRYAYLSNGDGTFTLQFSAITNTFGYPPTNSWAMVTGDFNGDGKSDYALVGSTNRYVYLSNGDGNFTLQYSDVPNTFGSPPTANWSVVSGDFNGDGKSDYALIGSSNQYVYLSTGDAISPYTSARSSPLSVLRRPMAGWSPGLISTEMV